MTPEILGQWSGLGLGGLLIALVGFSIFKLIDAWVQLSNAKTTENLDLRKEIHSLTEENNRLRKELYDNRKS